MFRLRHTFRIKVAPSHARSATCQTDNFQDELLSVHKIDQALPDAPGLRG